MRAIKLCTIRYSSCHSINKKVVTLTSILRAGEPVTKR